MILTRKQGQQIARQGGTEMKILDILRSYGFVAAKICNRKDDPRWIVAIDVVNTDNTVTRIVKKRSCGRDEPFDVRVIKPEEEDNRTPIEILKQIADMN